MNCHEFLALAGDLLEGECHSEAAAHLAACPRCRLLMDELGAIELTAHRLPAYEPSPALWTRLEAAALEEGLWHRPQGLAVALRWLGLAAPPAEAFWPAQPAYAGVLALLLVLGATFLAIPANESPLAARPTDPYQVAQAELVLDADYATRYALHLNRLESGLLTASKDREPELREMVARPLDTVDRAIEETRAELSANPDDPLSRDELLRLYRQKAEVLQAMANPVWYDDAR
jgi:hypothetical protein